MALKEGDQAPAFNVPGDGDSNISSAELRGRKLVLYFYPKDMTPGCTVEANDFSSMIGDFHAAGCEVVGVSKDSPARHDKFVAKQGLKIRLASDEDGKVLSAYGVWKKKSLYGRSFMGIERSTFLIDAEGIVRRIWRKVRVKGHAAEVLEAAREV